MKHIYVLLLVLAGICNTSAQEITVSEQNKAAVEKFMNILNQKDWADHAGALFDSVNYEYYKKIHTGFREVFPDYHYQLQMITAKGDSVFIMGIVTGTHSKTWDVFPGIPATGKMIMWNEAGIIILKNGKIVNGFVVNDRMSILNQLGYNCNPSPFKP